MGPLINAQKLPIQLNLEEPGALPVFGGPGTASDEQGDEKYLVIEEPLARESIGGASSRYRQTPKFDGEESDDYQDARDCMDYEEQQD